MPCPLGGLHAHGNNPASIDVFGLDCLRQGGRRLYRGLATNCRGHRCLRQKGSAVFWEHVLKDGPLEGDKRSIGQVQALNQIEQFFGPVQSSSILGKKAIGKKDCYVIWVLEYANGPAFSVANYYRSTKGTVVTSMNFKTEPEAILPRQFLVE